MINFFVKPYGLRKFYDRADTWVTLHSQRGVLSNYVHAILSVKMYNNELKVPPICVKINNNCVLARVIKLGRIGRPRIICGDNPCLFIFMFFIIIHAIAIGHSPYCLFQLFFIFV